MHVLDVILPHFVLENKKLMNDKRHSIAILSVTYHRLILLKVAAPTLRNP